MYLFDQIDRVDFNSSSFSESSFHYLNRSGRPGFQFIRQTMEEWFSRYPKDAQHELRSRFRSPLNVHHISAFFELFLHELLLCLDCAVFVHPSIEGTVRSPDFLVSPNKGDSFYLEATVATYKSKEQAAAEARLNQVYDVLNRRVDSTNFFIAVEINEEPNSQPPGRKIAQFLNERLKDLDPDEVNNLCESKDLIPNWDFEHDGWSINFTPIPKKPEARGKPDTQPLGMFSSGFRLVDHRTPLRDSILDKVSAYGNIGKPFVVAVNAMEFIDETDVMEALFGKEQFNISFSESSPKDVEDIKLLRIPDGVWTSKKGSINTRLSAALIVKNLVPWNLGEASCCLYHNPWASKPCYWTSKDLSQSFLEEGKMKKKDGESLIHILGVDWSQMKG